MSIETWKEEFYPVPADDRRAKRSHTAAVNHSLKKWRGLTKESLEKHGLQKISGSDCITPILGGEHMPIAGATCALCLMEDDRTCLNNSTSEKFCRQCPLFRTLGRQCDQDNLLDVSEEPSPYSNFIVRDDPLPMIKALEKTKKKLRAGVLRMDLPYYMSSLSGSLFTGKKKINEKSF